MNRYAIKDIEKNQIVNIVVAENIFDLNDSNLIMIPSTPDLELEYQNYVQQYIQNND
jgi:hypothetical protein